jgi:hypothetical protein
VVRDQSSDQGDRRTLFRAARLSVPIGTLGFMPDLRTVFAGLGVLGDQPQVRVAPPLATGLVALDRLLEGGLSGKVLLTALPGRGRSVLATQLALTAALAGRSVLLSTPLDDGWSTACRFVAATSGVPMHRGWFGRQLDEAHRSRIVAAQERLAALDLRFEPGPRPSGLASGRDVVVLDDLHLHFSAGWVRAMPSAYQVGDPRYIVRCWAGSLQSAWRR